MVNKYNFKSITTVPSASDFVDIMLSKTQRKTPTVVRKGWKISRIRSFYMRKVKYTQQTARDRLTMILEDFPRLEDLHPFYGSLINVLYSRDHYKLALGQLNKARNVVDNIAKDYLRMLKFGDSLYRCKQLKRAALGRMVTLMKKLNASLGYLEEVRQHLARLPSIDPATRTLIITGYPNVGKSSFMNKVSRADVDVQPYAFTTKSIFVGHLDYKYLRWQIIDTPGILDHPLEDRNTIEMQAVTALAHLHACVLFFVDISETCGYSIKQQVSLFHSIKPLFTNKPLLIVCTKTDIRKFETLDDEDRQLIQTMASSSSLANILTLSNISEDGISNVQTTACDLLLQHRVERKIRKLGDRTEEIQARIQITKPIPRDNKVRSTSIPQAVLDRRSNPDSMMDIDKHTTERDIEAANGGPGIYNCDVRKYYILKEDDWKWDTMPEIIDGKNIADYIDPDIDAKLQALEDEEEALEREYENRMDIDDDEDILDEDTRALVQEIKLEKSKRVYESKYKHAAHNVRLQRKALIRGKSINDVISHLKVIGLPLNEASLRSRSRTPHRVYNSDPMQQEERDRKRKRSRGSATRSISRPRNIAGLRDDTAIEKAKKQKTMEQRRTRNEARKGGGDRHHYDEMPKHLFSGKRGRGKTDWR